MRQLFQQELADLKDDLVDIAQSVEGAMDRAVRAFNQSDVQLAEEVIAQDHLIDDAVRELDEQAIAILARQAPVAGDLRQVISTLRISASLERMGDLASHLAQLARYRFPEKVAPKGIRPTFKEMGALDLKMAGLVVGLLQDPNTKTVDEIRDLDDSIDALHLSVFETVLSEEFGSGTATVVDATLASRYLERFADHGVSISKKVLYLLTGEWDPDSSE
ncbi:phosphate ABC transport system regulator PhoU [Pontimonas salivibrio]|uniref:Phosphate-specific transport system accessory protein PhoU n=1 Tax=Pontimonas salivibrio TaxID=1159327 RepID=A0A2L2BSJ6_9MICO|nr:phosphate signaling complex protein PhoU [Pontimonas salivibrio]AVG24638.1 phosphate ABC transport system regulator PhoU [Pontimonas salivibrio]